MKLVMRHAIMAAGALIALGTAAPAQITTPNFRGLSLIGYNNGSNDFVSLLGPGAYDDYIHALVPRTTSASASRTFAGDGVGGPITFSASGSAHLNGLYSTGSHVTADVTNAYKPNVTGVDEAPHGYYIVSGMGSWNRHRFVSTDSVTGPFAKFTWNVTGDIDANFGVANSRVEFAAGVGASSWDDLYFNPDFNDHKMLEFGPGQYEYNVDVQLGQVMDFLFWQSTYWQVNRSDTAALAGHMDLHGEADFSHTFDLSNIALFNADGSPIEHWSMVDEASGLVLWDQSGQKVFFQPTAVPEPGTYAMLAGFVVVGAGLVRRRRK